MPLSTHVTAIYRAAKAIPVPVLCAVLLASLYLFLSVAEFKSTMASAEGRADLRSGDAHHYLDIADDFAAGDFTMNYVAQRPHRQPLYPAALAPVVAEWGHDLFRLALVNISFATGGLLVVYLGALHFFRSSWVAGLVGLLYVFEPWLLAQTTRRLLTEPLHILLMLGIIVALLSDLKFRRARFLILVAILCGLDYLVRPNGLFVAFAAAIVVVVNDCRRRNGDSRSDITKTLSLYALCISCFALITVPSWLPRQEIYGNPVHHGYLSNYLRVDTYAEGHTGHEVARYHWQDYANKHTVWDAVRRFAWGAWKVVVAIPIHIEHRRIPLLSLLSLAGVLVIAWKGNTALRLLVIFWGIQLLPLIWTQQSNPNKRVPMGATLSFEFFFAGATLSFAGRRLEPVLRSYFPGGSKRDEESAFSGKPLQLVGQGVALRKLSFAPALRSFSLPAMAASLFLFLSGCSLYHPRPLTEAAVAATLRRPPDKVLAIAAAQIRHPTFRPVRIDLRDGISPDEAAVIAVLLNPALRADRDRRSLAQAQLVQAGVLPNPQVTWGNDYVIGGNTAGAITAFGLGASWDATGLLTLLPKIASAKANKAAVDLDVAWNEWQTAQSARLSALRIAGLAAQLKAAREGDDTLEENVALLAKAAEAHDKTVLDLAAAQAASRAARAATLEIEKQLEAERIALNRAMGFPPEARPGIEGGALPSEAAPPSYESLVANLETSRLDLLGLKSGYQSEDEALRAAIIAQVPRINLGFTRAGDTSNVQTLGFGLTVDIPIFDRNQGNIATERATRQKLFDEYADRVFQARADIATALSNIRWLNRQIAENQKSVHALDQLVKTAGMALRQGNGDAISYYQTRYDLILKHIEFYQLKVQLAESIVGLEIAAGRYLPLPRL